MFQFDPPLSSPLQFDGLPITGIGSIPSTSPFQFHLPRVIDSIHTLRYRRTVDVRTRHRSILYHFFQMVFEILRLRLFLGFSFGPLRRSSAATWFLGVGRLRRSSAATWLFWASLLGDCDVRHQRRPSSAKINSSKKSHSVLIIPRVNATRTTSMNEPQKKEHPTRSP